MFKNQAFTHSDRSKVVQKYMKERESRIPAYHFKDQNNLFQLVNLDTKDKMFSCSRTMNHQNKIFYSQCLDSKG